MGLTASLDMGSEKMVMALASDDHNACCLTGIKIVASQGMQRGMVKDRDKVRACIRNLAAELLKNQEVELMNIALSDEVLQISEQSVTISLPKRIVEKGDLSRAEQSLREKMRVDGYELLDLMPIAYTVSRGESVANPVGKTGTSLEAIFQVYMAREDYLSEIRDFFEECGIDEICFYPSIRAYYQALDRSAAHDVALIDLGAMGINVSLFRDGMLDYEARLPLGMRTIDLDIMAAYKINPGQARKLKHEYGQALRANCKNKKVLIPDTKLTLESRDLAKVIQSRTEELLEGAIYLLQNWGYNVPKDEIWLTGGGSRLEDVETLLYRLSGHPVRKAVVKHIQTSREEVLKTPEYFIALGLLLCRPPKVEDGSKGFWDVMKRSIGDLFGNASKS